jgi:hypothetical protein
MESTVTGLKVTHGLGLSVAGSRRLRTLIRTDTEPAVSRQVNSRMLVCCEDILNEKKRFLFCQTSVLDFFKSPSLTHLLPTVLLDMGENDLDDLPTF